MAKTKSKTTKKTEAESFSVSKSSNKSFIDKVKYDLQNNQSSWNLILGALIVLVVGVLLFNYFKRPTQDVGPSQQAEQPDASGDVAKENLPGKYTVKDGDTLFIIAEKYYDDGFKYTTLVETNKLANENSIVTGQVLDIPKLEDNTLAQASTSPSPTASPEATSTPTSSPAASPNTQSTEQGTGGAENQTIWGEKITGETYTVQEGDWLSKIAGRAYGDVLAYDRIAKANNISNPDLIEVGMVLKVPK